MQLEISDRVGRDITSILAIDDLPARVVDLIQDAFGYYHVQVFLLVRDAGQLVLRADGRTLSSEYRCLEMGQPSINWRARADRTTGIGERRVARSGLSVR